MINSVLISYTLKLTELLKKYYNNSFFNKVFTIVDDFLANAAVNSTIVKFFSNRVSYDILQGSIIYKFVVKCLVICGKFADVLKKWIIGSHIVKFATYSFSQFQSNTFKLVGIFGSAFIFANITYGLISNSFNIVSMIVKIVLLFLMLVLTTSKIAIKEVFLNSLCFKVLKWLGAYEN